MMDAYLVKSEMAFSECDSCGELFTQKELDDAIERGAVKGVTVPDGHTYTVWYKHHCNEGDDLNEGLYY